MHSSIANGVEQGWLPLVRPAEQPEVSLDVILRRKDFLSAINLCIDTSGLDDKELYLALGIDAGHWSNIRKGKPSAHFPTNKMEELMDLCSNEIPLIWLAHRRGKGVHMLETEAERQLRIEREKRREAEARADVLLEALRGR